MDVYDSALRVYLAGKIEKNDWRHDLVPAGMSPEDLFGDDPAAPWPVMERAVCGALDYTGPYFIGCDHGCSHGIGQHGIGPGCGSCDLTRAEVVLKCQDAIARADLVFAWLGDKTAYGTLVEIGYARALGKTILIGLDEAAKSREQVLRDLWFAVSSADLAVYAPSPAELVERLADSAATVKDSRRQGSRLASVFVDFPRVSDKVTMGDLSDEPVLKWD